MQLQVTLTDDHGREQVYYFELMITNEGYFVFEVTAENSDTYESERRSHEGEVAGGKTAGNGTDLAGVIVEVEGTSEKGDRPRPFIKRVTRFG